MSGPLIVGIAGTTLEPSTREQLRHPAVGGVILFSRNYETPEQLVALTDALRDLRSPRLLICVDQEGGRVQRFRDGFTALPPLAVLGRWYASHPERALDLAYRHGRVMAAEVLGHGVDMSFAPVLDRDGCSSVIGDRAFSPDADAVIALAGHYIAGMRDAGMAACGKHFPGHGSVAADSHFDLVRDPRSAVDIEHDLAPFRALVGQLAAVMPAHVCYPALDDRPAGFSRYWIDQVLRRELGFSGCVISDDLDMAGAAGVGAYGDRLRCALEAGCDLVLVCNPDSVAPALEAVETGPNDRTNDRTNDRAGTIHALYGKPSFTLSEQELVPEFRAWKKTLNTLSEERSG